MAFRAERKWNQNQSVNYYLFSTEAVWGLVWSRCQDLNQFFAFRQQKNWLLARETSSRVTPTLRTLKSGARKRLTTNLQDQPKYILKKKEKKNEAYCRFQFFFFLNILLMYLLSLPLVFSCSSSTTSSLVVTWLPSLLPCFLLCFLTFTVLLAVFSLSLSPYVMTALKGLPWRQLPPRYSSLMLT